MILRFDWKVLTSLISLSLPILGGAAQPSSSAGVAAKHMECPIRFEANNGQAPNGVDYVSRGTRHSLYLQKSGVRLDVPGKTKTESIVLQYVKPESARQSEGVDPVSFKSSYYIGANPNGWVQGVSNYGRVRYNNVWRGIDVVYYGNNTRLEYDLVIAAGADVKRAAFQVSGAQRLRVNANGDLLIQTASGDVVQQRAVAYQKTPQGRREVRARYAISSDTVSFQVGRYDHAAELIIDPVIGFSIPAVAGTEALQGTGVVVDTKGYSYVTGNTLPINDNPNTPNVYYTEVFVNQFDVNGNQTGQLIFGASDGDTTAAGIATDNAGSAYITGATSSASAFTLKNAYRTTSGGGMDAYLVRFTFTSTGTSLDYGTFLGGSGNDLGNGVAADASGHAYVAGQAASANFPRTAGNAYAGGSDAFLVKINTNATGASSLVYSYLTGGNVNDVATSVALDANGYAYVGGYSQSTNFLPNPNFGFATANPAGNPNGFLLKVNAAATPPVATYLTFFTGAPILAVAADSNQQAYVTGQANGLIPINSVNPGYSVNGNAGHAFVARFSTTVNGVGSLIYSSYLSGSASDAGAGIGVDGLGNATVVGTTGSTGFPLAGSPLQSSLNGPYDAFVSRVNTNASSVSSLIYSSYLGGSGIDSGGAVGMTPYGNPVITGQTVSSDFPTVTPGPPPTLGNNPRAFLTKLLFEAPPFGFVDTPTPNATNLSGDIGVTGWALSSIGISSVEIWRSPLPGEGTGANGLVFIENADLVPGARPDVANAFPNYPNNNWGWGVEVLTNELPGTNGLPLGNGTYTLHAIAVDNDGYRADIGSTNFSVNNTGSNLPFGTIDTPTQGGVASGTAFVNFGWALTPQPATIPTNGSTITVFIDNVAVGSPVYNQYRADVAGTFPGLQNSSGPVGYFYIDTTKYANGRHTIRWIVTDNAGHASSLGSRYFTVQN